MFTVVMTRESKNSFSTIEFNCNVHARKDLNFLIIHAILYTIHISVV